jgi:hypothetical protein
VNEQLQNDYQFRKAREAPCLGFSSPNRFKVPLSVAESLVPIGINTYYSACIQNNLVKNPPNEYRVNLFVSRLIVWTQCDIHEKWTGF